MRILRRLGNPILKTLLPIASVVAAAVAIPAAAFPAAAGASECGGCVPYITITGNVASSTSTTNPANAPQGTHIQTGSPSCLVSGLNVSCSSFELAGVGNNNEETKLSATYSATVVCINHGRHASDSQHQGTFTSTSNTDQLSIPQNGSLTVPSLSVTAPTEQQFLAQQRCPNPNWTRTIPGGITLSSFTYGVFFEGFFGTPLAQ